MSTSTRHVATELRAGQHSAVQKRDSLPFISCLLARDRANASSRVILDSTGQWHGSLSDGKARLVSSAVAVLIAGADRCCLLLAACCLLLTASCIQPPACCFLPSIHPFTAAVYLLRDSKGIVGLSAVLVPPLSVYDPFRRFLHAVSIKHPG